MNGANWKRGPNPRPASALRILALLFRRLSSAFTRQPAGGFSPRIPARIRSPSSFAYPGWRGRGRSGTDWEQAMERLRPQVLPGDEVSAPESRTRPGPPPRLAGFKTAHFHLKLDVGHS